jgi:hypothetical protein
MQQVRQGMQGNWFDSNQHLESLACVQGFRQALAGQDKHAPVQEALQGFRS